MVAIPFCGQTYSDKSPNANAQRSINLYPMRSPSEQNPNRIIMYPTPGYKLLLDVVGASGIAGAGAIRGVFEINGVLYVVSGTAFIKITNTSPGATFSSFSFEKVGDLNTSSGRCTISCNTVQLAINDAIYGYTYNLTTAAFQTIGSSGSFPASGGVTNFTYYDGYIIAGINNSKRVIHSNVLDAATFPTQAFDDVTSFADNLAAVFSDELQLYIFGPKVTEVQFDAGTTPYAFQRVQGVLIQAGCAASATIVKVGGSILWLASDAAGKAYVAALNGYNPEVISTAPVNEALEGYSQSDIASAFAYTYREGDNQFYVLTFPTATWAFDVKLRMWHERSVGGGRDLPDCYVSWQGQHVIGDSTGKLWLMSQDYSLDQNGNGLTRIRTCQHVDADGLSMFLDELQIDIESGVGLLAGQGLNPLAQLEVSKDGGNTWINCGTAGMGKMGEYRKRLLWRRLGSSRNTFTFRLTITDPVKTYILGARAKIRAGTK